MLIKLDGVRCQDEGAFIANIFDGALILKTIDGKGHLPVANRSFDQALVIHAVSIDVVAKNLNMIVHINNPYVISSLSNQYDI